MDIEREWTYVFEHETYIVWRSWQEEWYIVDIVYKNGEFGSVILESSSYLCDRATWCCDNNRGMFSIRNMKNHVGKNFFFEFEEDAVAFKLRWI